MQGQVGRLGGCLEQTCSGEHFVSSCWASVARTCQRGPSRLGLDAEVGARVCAAPQEIAPRTRLLRAGYTGRFPPPPFFSPNSRTASRCTPHL